MSKKYFFVLMQDEVKKVKIVGIEPKKYFSKKQQRDVTGFSLYFDQESEEVILLFADVVKEAMPFVVVFFFGGYIVKVFCNAAFGGRFKL